MLKQGLVFAGAMWLSSRLLILVAMMVIAPLLPAPANGIAPSISWNVFSGWDSKFYQEIATSGYEYVPDGKGYNVAFFPLFPLLIRAVMNLGLPVEVGGTLVNNLAFLGGLIVLYAWVEERHGMSAARWSTAILAWCPFSLFGTVIYTEGLFLLCTTAALRAFDQQQYVWASIWGAMASATRLPGLALVPAFLLVAWREKRSAIAYIASLAVSSSLLLYSFYCWLKFQEPLAFLIVQKAWHPPGEFYGQGWLKMLMQITLGVENWEHSKFIPSHFLVFLIICACSFWLWQARQKFGINTGYGFSGLILILWLLAGAPFINVVMVFGSAFLLWYLRNRLPLVAVTYGLFSFGLILSSGRTASAERYAYGIVSVAIALGLLIAPYPRWGYITLSFFAILLTSLSIRFAQHLWAG